jgi:hypothetical protein
MAFKTFAPGVLTSSDVNTFLMRQSVIVCTASTRPASPNEGMTIYETDTDLYRVYNGSTWVESGTQIGTTFATYTPTLSGSGWTFGAPTVTGVFTQVGRSVTVAFNIAWAGGVTVGGSRIEISLPVTARTGVGGVTKWSGMGYRDDVSVGTIWPHVVQPYTATTMSLYALSHSANPDTTSLVAIQNVAGLVIPVDNLDNWYGSLTYEAA